MTISSTGAELSKAIVVIVLIAGLLCVSFSVSFPFVKASGFVYIRADGSVDPGSAPIASSDNVTYSLTGSVSASVVIERSHVFFEGNAHSVQGGGSGCGFTLENVTNVTIRNVEVTGFARAFYLNNTSESVIGEAKATDSNEYGVYLWSSLNNSISENEITLGSWYGIYLAHSENNNISRNTIKNNTYTGMVLRQSSNNTIDRNCIAHNGGMLSAGIFLYESSNCNRVFGNNITENNGGGLRIQDSSCNVVEENKVFANRGSSAALVDSSIALVSNSGGNNITGNTIEANIPRGFCGSLSASVTIPNFVYHNNFVNNQVQVALDSLRLEMIRFDAGYPVGGNYWSDFPAFDICHGLYQNISGSDGIADEPNEIDSWLSVRDFYPLTKKHQPHSCDLHDIGITDLNASRTSRDILLICMQFLNYGNHAETFDATICANNATIGELGDIAVGPETFLFLNFSWNMSGFAIVDYVIRVAADAVQNETETEDNTVTYTWKATPPPPPPPPPLIHDLAIAGISYSKNVIAQGFSMWVSVTVENQGGYMETDVQIEYVIDGVSLLVVTVPSLAIYETRQASGFVWNTLGWEKGNYTIDVYILPVPAENETTDNTVSTTVYVGTPGDVNADGIVNMLDIWLIATHYGALLGQPDFVPNYDVDCSGIITMLDFYTAATNYGETAL